MTEFNPAEMMRLTPGARNAAALTLAMIEEDTPSAAELLASLTEQEMHETVVALASQAAGTLEVLLGRRGARRKLRNTLTKLAAV